MHILAGLIITAATIFWWISRASRGAGDVIDAAETVANLPRRYRHRKAVNKRGLKLVETPVEAATVLMLAISRMSDDRRLSETERAQIERELTDHMALEPDDADGLTRQMEMVHHDVTLPETTLFPMVDILKASIDREDARQLARMLGRVADTDGRTSEQTEFIRRYQERMGLLS